MRNHIAARPALYRKVGGLHFIRIWRFRMSFCLARPVTTTIINTKESNYGRTIIHERYLAG